MRGLKPNDRKQSYELQEVAPFVGAWIETMQLLIPVFLADVAPFVGAWIETRCIITRSLYRDVAPFVGAWIET